MGTRLLKEWIKYPLLKEEDILERQEKVGYLVDEYLIHHQLNELLSDLYDISRISTKIEYKTSNAQDLVRLKKSLVTFEKIKDLFEETSFLKHLNIENTLFIANEIEAILVDEPPLSIGTDPTIKRGVHQELDEYTQLLNDSNSWLLNYENRLKDETGIKNLKVGYSKQFGYYLEVSKGQLHLIKDEYGFIRRQTLTNAERYLSDELKQQEEKILSASSEIEKIETQLLKELNEKLLNEVDLIKETGLVMAQIDCLSSLASISNQAGFIKPQFTQSKEIVLIDSTHPILEFSTKSHRIIANDFVMDESQDIMILTGPNMGGKSTYMRQVAITIIMAQMGCYVKAKEAKLPLFDAIYTRMGASDDIMSGHSTFMIEMIEANQAITKATPQSLILFDEIGRGTSTYDGMAIAGSILDYLATKIKATTIFSTHYHQLTTLALKHSNIVNYQVLVQEKNQDITFLYKVEPGSANRSYGIHVAALADLPHEIIMKANQVLNEIQVNSMDLSEVSEPKPIQVKSKVSKQLEEIDIEQLTPLQALQLLDNLKQLNEREQDE